LADKWTSTLKVLPTIIGHQKIANCKEKTKIRADKPQHESTALIHCYEKTRARRGRLETGIS
jgi:hypothetical protein